LDNLDDKLVVGKLTNTSHLLNLFGKYLEDKHGIKGFRGLGSLKPKEK